MGLKTQGKHKTLYYWIFKVSNRQRHLKCAVEIQEDKYVYCDKAVLFGLCRTHEDV